MVEASDLVRRFMERGMHVTPGALEVMCDASESNVDQVLSDLEERGDRPSIVTDEIVSRILSSEETIPSTALEPSKNSVGGSIESESPEAYSAPSVRSSSQDGSEEQEVSEERSKADQREVKILRDITGESTSEGNVEDFVQLFRDRYEKLSSIIRSREDFRSYTELGNIARHEGEDVNLVGIVNSKRETRKQDAWIIEIEDLSGKSVIYIKDSERNKGVIDDIGKVVTDEVIGVKARVPDNLRSGNRNPLVWGNELVWPDIPVSKPKESSENDSDGNSSHAVLISDLHVGSSMFLDDVFEKFLEWINGSAGNEKQRELGRQVKYLIVAGDLVDGIGIYPGQQKELNIDNIKAQYEKVAELLSKVPNDIQIIAAPGNHDAVRLAEPQPAMDSEVTAPLKEVNIQLVGNPAFLSIEGVKFLVYHGMGFDDLISADKDLGREDAVLPMEEVLRRRHLAPIYGEPMGGRTPIAPEKEDYLTIDEVPDVLHCGHLHKYGCGEYRGVLLINSATFQGQTLFMKRKGVMPTPGRVPIVNLEKKKVRTINFA